VLLNGMIDEIAARDGEGGGAHNDLWPPTTSQGKPRSASKWCLSPLRRRNAPCAGGTPAVPSNQGRDGTVVTT